MQEKQNNEDVVVVEMNNEIKVKMKKRQLEIFKKFLDKTERTNENARYYDMALQMVELLPADIERFQELAKLDAVIGAWGDDGPTVVRFGRTGETLNDIVIKHINSFRANPNQPMLREMCDLYIELYEEELKKLSEK